MLDSIDCAKGTVRDAWEGDTNAPFMELYGLAPSDLNKSTPWKKSEI